jgi:APA family basic amino acid/polyamine antiporter
MSVVTTSALLFVAYLGFNVVCSMAPEVRDASRTIPRAIVISMGLVALVYVGVVVALIASGTKSGGEAAVGRAAQSLIGHWGGVLIAIGALVSTLSAANANILGSSEIMVRLASTRDVPTILGRMWRGHPAVSVLGGAVLYLVLLLVGSAQTVVALANVAAIGAMAVINVGAIAAQRDPGSPGMRLPLGPVLPVLGVLTALAQLVFIPVPEILVGVVLLAAGLGVYALRHRMHQPVHSARLEEQVTRGDTPMARATGGRAKAGTPTS